MEVPPGTNWNVFQHKRQVTITTGDSALCGVATILKLVQNELGGTLLFALRNSGFAAWEKVMLKIYRPARHSRSKVCPWTIL